MADPTAQQKSIALSFVDFLSKSGVMEPEQLEITQSMLKDAFKLGDDDKATVDLISVWPTEVSTEPEFDEEKWQEFKQVLAGKGYFKGCEEGDDEYKQREEKARAKFVARSNPYEGMSAEQLKAEGNSLMMKGQHKSAIGYYSKARSRLGTAHFYRQDFVAAVEAFKKAAELEPENEGYKQDLASAQEKMSSAPSLPGMPGGMPGFDMNSISQIMQNPGFQEMAKNVMQSPGFGDMVQNMGKNMGMDGAPGGAFDPAKMAEMWGGGAANMPTVEGEDGAPPMIPTPFGNLSKDALEKLHEDNDIKNNPKFAKIAEDMKTEGPMAIMKHMNDPEVQDIIGNFSKLFAQGGPGGAQQ